MTPLRYSDGVRMSSARQRVAGLLVSETLSNGCHFVRGVSAYSQRQEFNDSHAGEFFGRSKALKLRLPLSG